MEHHTANVRLPQLVYHTLNHISYLKQEVISKCLVTVVGTSTDFATEPAGKVGCCVHISAM